MSWLFSQALVEEYWQDGCSDGEPSALSNGKPTQRAYLQRDKMTDTWSRFPSGMTCEPLTEQDGEAVLMSFLEDFPARTSVPPEKALASTVSDPACGWKWPASSVKYDPDSCSWKTRQCSLLGGLVEFSETWPRWGSMRNGECWERLTWDHLTFVNGSGLWPTPCSQMSQRKTTDGQNISKSTGQKYGLSLVQAVKMWPTPQASDNRDRGNMSDPSIQRRLRIGKQIGLSTAVKPEKGSGSLNPMWVEWLMGWPSGWTSLQRLETAKSPNAPLLHLLKDAGGSDCER